MLKNDLPKSVGKWFEYFFDAYVEQISFNQHFWLISRLRFLRYLVVQTNPKIAERFELFIAGREIANGFND